MVLIKLVLLLGYFFYTFFTNKYFYIATGKFFIQIFMEIFNMILLIHLIKIQVLYNEIIMKNLVDQNNMNELFEIGNSTITVLIIFFISSILLEIIKFIETIANLV
jgi:hypothetical protein